MYWAENPDVGDIPVESECLEGWDFDGATFVKPPAQVDSEKTAEFNKNFNSKSNGFILDILNNLENRLRVLEGQPTINKGQYRNNLLTSWGSL